MLIQTGIKNVSGIGTGTWSEVSYNVTFPEAYTEVPMVVACVGKDIGNACGEYQLVTGRSKTGFDGWIGHGPQASSSSSAVNWIAIGIKN